VPSAGPGTRLVEQVVHRTPLCARALR
jgi:hypothetical protein